MQTKIITDGKETRIVLIPQNILEEKLIESLNLYKADVEVSAYVNEETKKNELYLDIKHKEYSE